MNRVERGMRHYFLELTGSMGLFVVVMVSRRALTATIAQPAWLKVAIVLSPIIPICLAAWAVVRLYQHTDEMHRKTMLENIAFGALFCAVGSIVAGFLSDVGLPKIAIGWAWPLMGMGWLLITLWRVTREAIELSGMASTMRKGLTILMVVGLPTLAYALIAPSMSWPHKPGLVILIGTVIFLAHVGVRLFRKEQR